MRSDVRLAVLGDPVAHSLSPAMHQAALRHCGLEGSYERVHTRPEGLAEVVARLRTDGYTGFNVTIPHKQGIIPLLDRLDHGAKRIGAVNTVVAAHDEQSEAALAGYNTDGSGLSRIVSGLPSDGKRRALVLGAGGAARAAVDALLTLGWEVTVANRTVERAQAAFSDRARVMDLGSGLNLGEFSLMINGTSAGMNAPDESPLPDSVSIPRHLTVVELVYSPMETRLLAEACAAGCRVVEGLELLAAQAADSFELWTGRRLPDLFFRQAAEAGLKSRGDGTDNRETTRLSGHIASTCGSFSNDPYDGLSEAAV
jgi:shikimate dehydrogenase